jgi:hypothetical protein
VNCPEPRGPLVNLGVAASQGRRQSVLHNSSERDRQRLIPDTAPIGHDQDAWVLEYSSLLSVISHGELCHRRIELAVTREVDHAQ